MNYARRNQLFSGYSNVWVSIRISLQITLLLVGGCVSSQPVESPTHSISISVPSISPQDETKYRQPKGGIEISMGPVSYKLARDEQLTYTASQPRGAAMILGPVGDVPQVHVDWEKKTDLHVQPSQLAFLVKLNNQLPRVFHGAGMVVQFNVDGQLQPVTQDGYQTLTNSIVPPRTEQEVTIVGPPLDALKKSKGVIGVFLYDVVTAQNEAGTVTEKQNFEWYFNYDMQTHSEIVPYSAGNGWMPAAQYQEYQVKQVQKLRGTAGT